MLPEGCADVVGRVVGADDDDLLPAVGLGSGVGRGVLLLAAEAVHAGEPRHAGLAAHAGGEDQLGGVQGELLAVAVDLDVPVPGGFVPPGRAHGGGAPVVQLHDPHVHLQPVADLVLRREDRPVRRERQVGQVVVPDRVVQAQGLVAAAPLVPGAGVAVHDDGGDVELAQPGTQGDAALPAADDQHVGLAGVAELGGLGRAALQPGLPVLVRPVLGAHRPVPARLLLVTRQLVQRGQQGPRRAVLEAQVAAAAPHGGLELDPGLGDTPSPRGRGPLLHAEPGRVHPLQHLDQARPDRLRPLGGGDVPGEGDQVPPEALGPEESDRGIDVACGQRRLELLQPGVQVVGHRAPPGSFAYQAFEIH